MSDYNWMPEARAIAAQCWCDEETRGKEMDATLCEAVARRIAAWMQTGAQHAQNESYWRDQVSMIRAEGAELDRLRALLNYDRLYEVLRASGYLTHRQAQECASLVLGRGKRPS